MVHDSERVKKEGVLGAWIPLVIVTIVMVVLTYSIFWGHWQFWMWFAVMGAAIPVVIVSILYYGRDSKKCPNCSTRMDFNVQYCNKCGTHIPSRCPKCDAHIQPNGVFCEKCGVKIVGTSTVINEKIPPKNPQSVEKPINGSNGNYKYCPACGNKTESYANHCSSCGIEI